MMTVPVLAARLMSFYVAVLAALLLSSIAARAASPEDAYLAARDRDIAALEKIDNANESAARDAEYEKADKDLERQLKAIIGPFAVTGFPAEGKLNLDSLSPDGEGSGMLDGLVYGESESDKNVVVTTDGLFDTWLLANHKLRRSNTELPADTAAALKSEIFYTMAVSTDSAVVHYAELPVAASAGAKFAYATLSARTQDESPQTPDQIFVALEHGGRVFIVNEKLTTLMMPIAACDAVKGAYTKRADALDNKAAAERGPKKLKLSDQADTLRNEGDPAFRACFGKRVKTTPAFKAATDQAAAVVAAFTH